MSTWTTGVRASNAPDLMHDAGRLLPALLGAAALLAMMALAAPAFRERAVGTSVAALPTAAAALRPSAADGRDPSLPDAASVLLGREPSFDEPVPSF